MRAEEAQDKDQYVRTSRAVNDAWYDLMSNAEYPLNVRIDLSLKQRCPSDLCVTVRDPSAPEHVLRTIERRPVFASREQSDVRPARSKTSLRACANAAAFYYLTEDEARRIASRVVNRLNRAIFGRAARAKTPKRLTALVCQHDKGTRRHLHALMAIPPDIEIVRRIPEVPSEFETLLDEALKSERFVARIHKIEPLKNAYASLAYNIRDDKTINDNSILYVHCQPRLAA